MSDNDRPKSEQPYEVLGTSRRYVLGEIPGGYGIWDSLTGDQLVERFPLTEDGLDVAMERFDELKRRDRGERWNLFRVVWIGTVTGAVLWLLAGTLRAALFGFGSRVDVILTLADTLGYRLAVGSLLVLVALLALRRVPTTQNRLPPVADSLKEAPSRGFDLLLRTVLIAALTVWILSAIATDALFRVELERLGPPSRPAIAAQMGSTLAFRLWWLLSSCSYSDGSASGWRRRPPRRAARVDGFQTGSNSDLMVV